MNKTKIPYADYTWNVVTGCLAGCPYCFAKRISDRFGSHPDEDELRKDPRNAFMFPGENLRVATMKPMVAFPFGFLPTFYPDRLEEPLKVKKPSRIFVSDMGDLWGDWVPRGWIEAVLDTVRKCPQHTFLMLTKNPKRYQEFEIPDNAAIGTTVEDESKLWRVEDLLKTKAKVRFLSLEPLQNRICLRRYFRQPWFCEFCYKTDYSNMLPSKWDLVWQSAVCPECQERVAKNGGYGVVPCGAYATKPEPRPWKSPIHWVIVGAQSGPNAVQMDEDWVREIRDECQEFRIPMFYKQRIVNGKKVEMPELDGRVWGEYPRGYVLDA